MVAWGKDGFACGATVPLYEVLAAWEEFCVQGCTSRPVRKVIQDSWARCRELKVSPQRRAAPLVEDGNGCAELRELNRALLDGARSTLDEVARILNGSGHIAILCDGQARVLEVVGDKEALRAAERVNAVPGGDFSEAGSGTNAMGTALAAGSAVVVLGCEHYAEGLHVWGCAAAPIRDPRGNIVGILDISSYTERFSDLAPAAAVAMARAIEEQLRCAELYHRAALIAAYTEALRHGDAEVVLAFDGAGCLVRASANAPTSHPLLQVLVHESIGSGHGRNEVLRDECGQLWFASSQVIRRGVAVEGAVIRMRRAEVADIRARAPRHSHATPSEPTAAAHALENPETSDVVLPGVVGSAPAFRQALEVAARVACTNATVLITGETGTGKEVLARAIHARSHRAKGPFVAVNCGAFSPGLVASELFGYVPGAFTGAAARGAPGKVEAASGGTLFLDEIGELPLEVQAHLLRVLQEREVVRVGGTRAIPVDIRVIAATNRDLKKMVENGQFRADLYFRLNVVEIQLPPLRDRREDIPALLAEAFARAGAPGRVVPPSSLARLMEYHWPGNVRELFNLVERAVILDRDPAELLPASDPCTQKSDLSRAVHAGLGATAVRAARGAGCRVGNVDRERLVATLAECQGNVSEAARRLNVSRGTLYRWMERHKVEVLSVFR